MALVSKILESTLTAGSTTVTFTDSDIPNSLIRVFSSNSDIIPESRILSGNTLTVTYAPQSNNIDVALEIVKQGLDIVDNVLSEDTDKALSAKQGYMLSAAIGDVSDGLSTLSETVNNLDIPDNITDLNDVTVNNIQSGQVLAWDGTSKFVNVNQSGGGGSESYSTEEQAIGTFLNETLYRKVVPITENWNFAANTWVKSNIPQGDMKALINGRIEIFYNNTYSLHFVQLGFIDNMLAGNSFRQFQAVANGANLIVEYTKTT